MWQFVGKKTPPDFNMMLPRPAWQAIDVQRESVDKVHLAVRINRFNINDQLIADFDSLWVITLKNCKWAAQFRSSFAAS